MVTYQGAKHVQKQLDSIVSQSRQPDEIVVSDDASTDGTWEILRRFAAEAPVLVQLRRQAQNLGLRANVTTALSMCSGSVIVLADQDDLWMPDKLAAVEAAFLDPNVTLWFSDASLIDDTGAAIDGTAWKAVRFQAEDHRGVSRGRGLRRLLHGMTVTGATMAVRSDVLDAALPLPERVGGRDDLYLHDGWMAVIAALMGETVADATPYTAYRQHDGQFSGQTMARAVEDRSGGPSEAVVEHPRPPADRLTQLRLDSARTSLVASRVRAHHSAASFRQDAVQELFDLEAFLDTRSSPQGWRRRQQVVRQLFLGHYSRFARGLLTAAKDLL